jgi:hypothetical protein
LLQYERTYGQLPPAVVVGKSGEPLYSWRVVILPFLDEQGLYKQFKLDEPWDSAHNKTLLAQMPPVYVPALEAREPPYATHFQVFVGHSTAFEHEGLTLADFPDGLANTILVVEAREPVPWTKPADLTYDADKPIPALGGLSSKPTHFLGYEVNRKPGFCAVFADGSTRFISNRINEKTLRSLITRNGSEDVDLSKLE